MLQQEHSKYTKDQKLLSVQSILEELSRESESIVVGFLGQRVPSDQQASLYRCPSMAFVPLAMLPQLHQEHPQM